MVRLDDKVLFIYFFIYSFHAVPSVKEIISFFPGRQIHPSLNIAS